MRYFFAMALLLLACNPESKTPEPGPLPVAPEQEEVRGASARPQNTPPADTKAEPPEDTQTEPPAISFKRSMRTTEGLWNSQVEELELVKGAIKGEDYSYIREGCEWEPLQSGVSFEWTWMNCHENALTLFRVKDGTWTLLKVPKHFELRNQEGCGERYFGAREHVAQDQVWLIWSWELTSYTESEEFIEVCEEDGSCSSGRSGNTSSHETLHGYDVVIRPDDARPYLVMRSRLELESEALDSDITEDYQPISVKGTQLQIEATYLGDEVHATHRLAKINGKLLNAETSGGVVLKEFNKNGRKMIGKAKLVNKASEPLKPVEWDKVECL